MCQDVALKVDDGMVIIAVDADGSDGRIRRQQPGPKVATIDEVVAGSQFYIVQGPGPIQPAVLERMRASAGTGVSYTPEDVARYAEVGGTPPLDGGYTVFGEVVEGMEVVDAIAASDTPRQHGDAGPWADRPVQAVKVVVRPVVE